MKSILNVHLLILLAVTFITGCGIMNGSTTVEFEDENLEQAIREEINKPTGEITSSDVKKLKT